MANSHVSIDVIGRAIADLRTAIGWSQTELGRRVGLSQAMISRIEGRRLPTVTFATVERILGVMGARLVLAVDAPYLGDRPRQRDPAHSRMSAHVVTRLRQAGWQVAVEVEIGGDRSRGWIDVLAWHPGTGVVLVIELKTEIVDLGAIQRTLGWYEREAWAAARRLGWRPRSVASGLLLLATAANDRRVAENRDVLAAEFPLRASQLMDVVGGLVPLDRGCNRGVAMVDPRSRRTEWLRPLRTDGRRTAAPYADYAAFLRSARGR